MTMEIKEITRMAIQIEKLQKTGDYEDISCLLTALYNTRVTLEQLQTTDIAKIVYQLIKSCPVTSVQKRAKGLLTKWKRLYGSPYEHKNIKDTGHLKEREATGQDKAEISTRHLDRKVTDSKKVENSNVDQEPRDPSSEEATSSKEETSLPKVNTVPLEEDSRTTLTVPPQISSSTNSTALRTKCVELLLQALKSDQADPEQTNQLHTVAHIIETHIHALHGHNLPKYKSCIRSKVANLKNPKSPHLRQGLLTGTLAPEAFVRMCAQEMAGDELRRVRQGYTAAGISERQLPQGLEGTPTTKVRCQRCEGTDCRVTQISSGTLFLPSWVKRGSTDEGAMTFMTCARCGAQWYHNRWVCL